MPATVTLLKSSNRNIFSTRERIQWYSTKSQTGFGLAHAKRVFEAHGGSINLVPTESGATFDVII